MARRNNTEKSQPPRWRYPYDVVWSANDAYAALFAPDSSGAIIDVATAEHRPVPAGPLTKFRKREARGRSGWVSAVAPPYVSFPLAAANAGEDAIALAYQAPPAPRATTKAAIHVLCGGKRITTALETNLLFYDLAFVDDALVAAVQSDGGACELRRWSMDLRARERLGSVVEPDRHIHRIVIGPNERAGSARSRHFPSRRTLRRIPG